ncbi:MAG TPA: UvrD-helicase domain-containing protein [Pirellulales bacterium]|nr:UvrD-helicase domain-containing protein [Pirellulales bacterium]
MPHELNPAQREAVHTVSGPLLVLAGAGTGKTRVVTYRIAELIRCGTPASRILALTFTNKAAAEMQERAQALLGRRNREKPEISTFHSLCVRILRRQIEHLGYPKAFAIYDRGDQETLARQALREIRVPGEVLRPGDLLFHIGRWKTHSVHADQATASATSDKEHLAAMGYRRYQRALKAAGAVDFDDLLNLTEAVFSRSPEIRRTEAGRFSHLLIDEYQDTNAVQYRIVKALAAGHRNLCVVGDDDQSIYGFRGAEVAHILRFREDWPDAKVVRLEDNYRSTDEILRVANTLIAFNRQRHQKILRAARSGGEKPVIVQAQDENDEAARVVADIRARLEWPGVQPRDVAILFRTNEQPRPFEMELRKARLPYVLIGGQSFYDRKEVRDVTAYLKVLVNPRDEASLLRIINTPARGISQSTVAAILPRAVEAGKPLWDVLGKAAGVEGVSPAAAEAIKRFCELIESHRARLDAESPLAVVSPLIQSIGYRDEIARISKDPDEEQSRWQAVEEVINTLSAFERGKERPNLREFLDEITLSGREEDRDKESRLARNAIVLLTLHSAKGLEFPQVYLVGMEEGLLPHHKSIKADATSADAIDEERRLCYVGVTRAQDRLTLSLALSRMKWGKPRQTMPSRFLYELTGKADNPHSADSRKLKPSRMNSTRATAQSPRDRRAIGGLRPYRPQGD